MYRVNRMEAGTVNTKTNTSCLEIMNIMPKEPTTVMMLVKI